MQAPTNDPHYPGGAKCTSGFPAKSNVNGAIYVTVAAHCYDPYDTRMWSGTSGIYMGHVTSLSLSNDVGFVKVSDAGNSAVPEIYDGGYGNDSSLKNVVGYETLTPNHQICVSGSYTRLACSMVVLNVNQQFNAVNPYSGAGYTVHGALVASATGQVAFTGGDSGGAAFANTNGNTQALAAGFMSAGYSPYTVACPSWVGAGAVCASAGLVTPAANIASGNNVAFTW